MSSSVVAGLSLETVLYEKKSGIAYITLNRPKVLNALNKRAIADLKTALEDARDDSEVHGVILTGAGDKAFIAGADINEVATDTPVQAEEKTRHGQALMTLIENLGKPVIAAINGFALGGGCEAALASTIRLAAENARFGLPEVKLGIMPGYGGPQNFRAGEKGTQLMNSDNIFSGLKVVEMASFIAGPGAAVILSDFGADVIKVEPPTGDTWRNGYRIPPHPRSHDNYPWQLNNRNK